MTDGLLQLLAGHDGLEVEAVVRNIAELLIFAHQYAQRVREESARR